MSKIAVWLAFVILLVGACTTEPSATPAPTSRFATIEGTITRQALPPTWTASPPPTITPTYTPSPVPTAPPTPSADDICDGFNLLYDFTERHFYPWEGYIPIIASLESPDAAFHFEATRRQTTESAGFDLPGGQAVAVEFRINTLPQPGIYDWVLSVRHDAYGDLCQHTGWFVARQPRPTAEATAEVTAEATAGD